MCFKRVQKWSTISDFEEKVTWHFFWDQIEYMSGERRTSGKPICICIIWWSGGFKCFKLFHIYNANSITNMSKKKQSDNWLAACLPFFSVCNVGTLFSHNSGLGNLFLRHELSKCCSHNRKLTGFLDLALNGANCNHFSWLEINKKKKLFKTSSRVAGFLM